MRGTAGSNVPTITLRVSIKAPAKTTNPTITIAHLRSECGAEIRSGNPAGRLSVPCPRYDFDMFLMCSHVNA
jgi:hypothetical protein